MRVTDEELRLYMDGSDFGASVRERDLALDLRDLREKARAFMEHRDRCIMEKWFDREYEDAADALRAALGRGESEGKGKEE